MSQLKGYEIVSEEHKVCRLKKSLYGLNEAPHAWFTKLSERMRQLRYEVYDYQDIDVTLFIKCQNDKVPYLLIFMDDMLIIRNSE